MKNDSTNLEASIHARLLNYAKTHHQPFEHVLKRYAMERFLYRLSVSSYVENFVLKGGLLMASWEAPSSRPTTDIDLQSVLRKDGVENIAAIVKDICKIPAEADAIYFNADTVVCEPLTHTDGYEGIRARFFCFLGRADIAVQIDIGFGGPIFPPPEPISYPTLLNLPAPKLSGYRRETVIAEKLESMAKHDTANTRMKDFYDVLLMAKTHKFEKEMLSKAIHQTFKSCRRDISSLFLIFRPEFANEPSLNLKWKSFLLKNSLSGMPSDFPAVMRDLMTFILPVIEKPKSST